MAPETMWRRAFKLLVVLSATAFAVVLICYVRGYFVQDGIYVNHWNPTARRFSTIVMRHDNSGFHLHTELTTATPQDNTVAIMAQAGTGYHSAPTGYGGACPLLWANHYLASADVKGISPNVLSDCRTLDLRTELPLTLFAILPTVWCARRFVRSRRAARRGFAMESSSF